MHVRELESPIFLATARTPEEDFPPGPRRKNLAGLLFKKNLHRGPYRSSEATDRRGEARYRNV